LAFPLVTGLAAGRPGVTAIAFTVAAAALFLAHEPAAVLMGRRGGRLQQALAGPARARLGWLSVLGVGAAVLGVALGSPTVRLAALVPALFALALVPAMVRGEVKTLGAELLVVAHFSATLLPVALAGGAGWGFAWAATAVWFASFALGTVAVHGIKAAHKQQAAADRLHVLVPVLAVAAVGFGVLGAVSGRLSWAVGLAPAPPVLAVLVIWAVRVQPRRLKRVGWSLVTANLVTLGLLLAG
jgi:hypothetical protein